MALMLLDKRERTASARPNRGRAKLREGYSIAELALLWPASVIGALRHPLRSRNSTGSCLHTYADGVNEQKG